MEIFRQEYKNDKFGLKTLKRVQGDVLTNYTD
jgi:hypothetical protein